MGKVNLKPMWDCESTFNQHFFFFPLQATSVMAQISYFPPPQPPAVSES